MTVISRRSFLQTGSLLAMGSVAGCSLKKDRTTSPGRESRSFFLPAEEALIRRESQSFPVVCQGGTGSRVLRRLTREVPEDLDLGKIAARMEYSMRQAGGVGIAGPQVGLGLRIATVMLDCKTDHPKVVFARNPYIIERSDELQEGYEGCLSIPEKGGLVRRNAWVVVKYQTQDGNQRVHRADSFNAVLWQHELDHLEGILYVDKLVGELMSIEEMRRRREAQEKSVSEHTSGTIGPASDFDTMFA